MNKTIIETQVSQSTKIAKQVMISKLTEKSVVTDNVIKSLKEEISVLRRNNATRISDTFCRLAIKKSSPLIEAAKVLDEVAGDYEDGGCDDPLVYGNYYSAHLFYGDHYYQKGTVDSIIETGEVDVEVEVDRVYHNKTRIKIEETISITVPADIVQMFKDMEIIRIKIEENLVIGIDTIKQLTEVDAYIDKIEAQLLAKELNKTTEGSEVLRLTEEILSGALGDNIKLLDSVQINK